MTHWLHNCVLIHAYTSKAMPSALHHPIHILWIYTCSHGLHHLQDEFEEVEEEENLEREGIIGRKLAFHWKINWSLSEEHSYTNWISNTPSSKLPLLAIHSHGSCSSLSQIIANTLLLYCCCRHSQVLLTVILLNPMRYTCTQYTLNKITDRSLDLHHSCSTLTLIPTETSPSLLTLEFLKPCKVCTLAPWINYLLIHHTSVESCIWSWTLLQWVIRSERTTCCCIKELRPLSTP